MTATWTSIVLRVRAQLGLKLWLTLLLWLAFCVPYFTVQRLRPLVPTAVPLTGIDHWIAFNPNWVFAYQSIYLLLPLLPWLCTRRNQLRSYALGFACTIIPAFACFVFLPTIGPRPAEPSGHAAYAMMISYDGPGNAWPSLHIGLALYTFLFGWRLLPTELSRRSRAGYVFVATLWTGLIGYSTLATKQHGFVDLPPGLLLACLGDVIARKLAPFGADTAPPSTGDDYAMATAVSDAGNATLGRDGGRP